MKRYFIICLWALPFLVSGQDSLDIWISKINNHQIKLSLGYIGYGIRIEKSNEIVKILESGNSASNKLLDLITSESKGVMAHYLLTCIFNRPNYHRLDCIESGRFCYNGLELETNGNFEFSAKEGDLHRCKAYWTTRLEN